MQAIVGSIGEAGQAAARGQVGDEDPLQAVADALAVFPADALILAVHAPVVANRRERRFSEKVRARFELPVSPSSIQVCYIVFRLALKGRGMTVDPLIGIALAALLYQLGSSRMGGGRRRREGRWRAQAFYAGLAALVVATEPPLDGLADRLFWAHMLQHMLLQMVAPPLLVLGAPWLPIWRALSLPSRRRLSRWVLGSSGAAPRRFAARVLGLPAVAWTLFIGTIALSHLPGVFDLVLRDTAFHEGEHALFLGLGLLFWSRALDSPPFRARLRPPRAIVFFLSAVLAESLLALAIMGAPSPLYAPYSALRPRPEGLSAIADQQFGGALMLEPASLPLLLALLWSIKRWLANTEKPLPLGTLALRK